MAPGEVTVPGRYLATPSRLRLGGRGIAERALLQIVANDVNWLPAIDRYR